MFWPLALAAAAVAYWLYKQLYEKRLRYPPGPTPWPLMGNIFQLDRARPEKTLVEWGKQYGPVFTIWLPQPHVIIGDFETMKDTFVKQGDVFAGRPPTFLTDNLLNGNYGLVFSQGRMWRENRRFSLHAMRDFGIGRNILEPQIMDQARLLVNHLHERKGKPVIVRDPAVFAVGNVINILAFGYAYKTEADMVYWKTIFEEFLILFTKPTIMMLEIMPWLRYLELWFGVPIGYKRLREINNELISFIFKQMNEHKKDFNENEQPKDYVDAYFHEMRRREGTGDEDLFSEWQMMAALGDLWGAGFETTVTTIRFFINYVLTRPDVQKKLHDEIDDAIGRERDITMNDQKQLHYLCATLQEVQRLANIIPINLQHTVTEDVKVAGYLIPKDTIVVAQTPTVHLDPKIYPDPDKFEPSRHIDSEGHFVKDEHVMPFSLGKRCKLKENFRACLGESLARMELFLFLATMLQCCEFRPLVAGHPPPVEVAVGLLRGPVRFECLVEARN